MLRKDGTNQFTVVKNGDKCACYLAPEVFNNMKGKNVREYDRGKADVYSLGITVLSAAL